MWIGRHDAVPTGGQTCRFLALGRLRVSETDRLKSCRSCVHKFGARVRCLTKLKGPASRRNNIVAVRLSEPQISTSDLCKCVRHQAKSPSHQVCFVKPSFWQCPSPHRGVALLQQYGPQIFCLTFHVDRALQRIRHLFHRSPVQSQDRRSANEICWGTTRLKTHGLINSVQQHRTSTYGACGEGLC